jgi:hypothetical protein
MPVDAFILMVGGPRPGRPPGMGLPPASVGRRLVRYPPAHRRMLHVCQGAAEA